MSYSNETTKISGTPSSGDNSRKIILAVLTIALLGTWGYIIYDKNKSKQEYEQLQAQYTNVDSARGALVVEFEDARRRMDSLVGTNTQLTGELAEKQGEISRLRDEIAAAIRSKNANVSKLNKLIAEYKGQVNDLFAEIEKLKEENANLTSANTQLKSERDTLTTQKQLLEQDLNTTKTEKRNLEDIGSTFHVSNINIAAINIKSGGKEKSTETAKRADLLRISFDIDENRIASSGTKEVYVVIIDPKGNVVSIPGTSGTFNSREEGEKVYTSKAQVNYEQGKRTPVSFDWKQESRYETGDYRIQVYHNGFKIGEGVKTLKKGGLFS